MTNIILCGGSGTRLWPVSRTLMPKQFVKLFDNKSLFQLTVERNAKLCDAQFIVSNAEQYFLALDQLEELPHNDTEYLLEPVGRNTAPAIALACMALDPEEIVLVTPSDHLIKESEAYSKVIEEAQKLAFEGHLVTFGITPKYAETGFGYIEASPVIGNSSLVTGMDVVNFHEKPDIETANAYLEKNTQYTNNESTNYYMWNSGMFCFKAGVFLEELKKHALKIHEASKAAFENAAKEEMIRIKHDDMMAILEESIDYAVMEKSDKVKVVPSDIGWSDLGSFDALYEELDKDEAGNTLNPNHISIGSRNNLIYGSERKIATVDIEDTIVVDTGDALLIAKKGSSQRVKEVVAEIRKNTELHHIHLTGHRPWGTYTVLEESDGYKIKHIEVKPGKRLSLQKHYHRNEHWIVLSGSATVTVNDKEFIVNPNESTYIKAGDIHRLENRGKLPLVIIEAQVGEYTGEDDIVRLDDDYHREA
ncbi:MAG: mannose-1-phosphate guanylyltransferase/mannose-6-phosphate isomerase [Campylobacterales bacterium]|nr:mannose-1-phosphate guanylyltransferase/mannose-6-phosphate isomerase [Campylobacterales bacterium]